MADILVRKRSSDCPRLEVRVAVIGNVDSGKSTLVGVLTRGLLDDGRGLARSKVPRSFSYASHARKLLARLASCNGQAAAPTSTCKR